MMHLIMSAVRTRINIAITIIIYTWLGQTILSVKKTAIETLPAMQMFFRNQSSIVNSWSQIEISSRPAKLQQVATGRKLKETFTEKASNST